MPHNCILFSVTSPGGKKKRTKKKITKLIFLASPPQQSNREVTGCPGEEAAAVGACASTSWLPSPDLKLGLSPLDCRGREGRKKKKKAAALSQSRKKGRPRAFPVVQLKQAKTSLHLRSLRVSAD